MTSDRCPVTVAQTPAFEFAHPSKEQFVADPQICGLNSVEGQDNDQAEAEEHPLLIWTRLSPCDVVSLRWLGNLHCVGTVEARTSDGLIIWMRDDLNERKAFHFGECRSVHRIQYCESILESDG